MKGLNDKCHRTGRIYNSKFHRCRGDVFLAGNGSNTAQWYVIQYWRSIACFHPILPVICIAIAHQLKITCSGFSMGHSSKPCHKYVIIFSLLPPATSFILGLAYGVLAEKLSGT